MTGFDIFFFFGLPVLILAGSIIGLTLLKLPAKARAKIPPEQPIRSTAVVRYEVAPLVLPRAANQ